MDDMHYERDKEFLSQFDAFHVPNNFKYWDSLNKLLQK